jgi:hypothetical protein
MPHTAVWTGSFMIVWGLSWGGRYAFGHSEDNDLDGYSECSGDCNDLNPLVWFPPAEVNNLTLTGASPTSLGWDSQSYGVGPETRYDLVSGSIPSAGSINFALATCLQSTQTTAHTDLRADPDLGGGFWYLVGARNSCGTGTFGSAERDQGILPCP